MVFAVPTFQLYDDSILTVISSSSLALTCESDLSDGHQDFLYYFGSTASNKQLQAVSNPGVDSIYISPTYILPSRANSTSYSLGDSVVPATPNGYRYVCTTAGTSGSSVPTWGTTLNGTTTDGAVVWTLVSASSPTTEIILSLTSGGLDTNTPGAALSLGNTVDSGVSNAKSIYVRVTNTITAVSSSLSTPELGLSITNSRETVAP